MLRAASVGLGWWSDELAKAIAGTSERIKIVACTSRSPEKRRAFSEAFGARPLGSYEEVLGDPEIDAVLLTTPHSLHAEHVIAAARAGKHTFVEKPFTLTAASGRKAAAACARAGVVLAVGHNRRFLPAAQALKRMVEAQEFGTILHVEANFSAPGALGYTPERWRANRIESPAGALAGLGIHMIDTMSWLFGPVRRLACLAKRRAVQVDIDDTTSALLEFDAGMTGYLGSHFACPNASWLRVYATKANAEARDNFAALTVTRGSTAEPVTLAPLDSLKVELEAFAAACAGEAQFPIAPAEAVHDVAIMEAMAASALHEGKWTNIPDRASSRGASALMAEGAEGGERCASE
jgi:predicted dehydrogenase